MGVCGLMTRPNRGFSASFSVIERDSLLTFAPYFTVIPQDRWKFQTLDVTLFVPEGTVIIFDKMMFHDRIHRSGIRWMWNSDYPWVMTENRGLQRAEKVVIND